MELLSLMFPGKDIFQAEYFQPATKRSSRAEINFNQSKGKFPRAQHFQPVNSGTFPKVEGFSKIIQMFSEQSSFSHRAAKAFPRTEQFQETKSEMF